MITRDLNSSKPLKKGNTNDILALYKLPACRLCQGHGVDLAFFSAPWSPTAVKWNWDPHIGGVCPKFSSQPRADYQRLLSGTMFLWILWKWKFVSVHAKSFHGPPTILNHHSCSVNKWVIFRNGSPVSFPEFLHSSLDPLTFFYSPLLQKKTKRFFITTCLSIYSRIHMRLHN